MGIDNITHVVEGITAIELLSTHQRTDSCMYCGYT